MSQNTYTGPTVSNIPINQQQSTHAPAAFNANVKTAYCFPNNMPLSNCNQYLRSGTPMAIQHSSHTLTSNCVVPMNSFETPSSRPPCTLQTDYASHIPPPLPRFSHNSAVSQIRFQPLQNFIAQNYAPCNTFGNQLSHTVPSQSKNLVAHVSTANLPLCPVNQMPNVTISQTNMLHTNAYINVSQPSSLNCASVQNISMQNVCSSSKPATVNVYADVHGFPSISTPSAMHNSSLTGNNTVACSIPKHHPPVNNSVPNALFNVPPPNFNQYHASQICPQQSVPTASQICSQLSVPTASPCLPNQNMKISVPTCVCTTVSLSNCTVQPLSTISPYLQITQQPNIIQQDYSSLQQSNMPINIDINIQNNLSIVCDPKIKAINDFFENLKQKKSVEKKIQKSISIPQFRCMLRSVLETLKLVCAEKANILNMIDAEKSLWDDKMKQAQELKCKLSMICQSLLTPEVLRNVQKKLKTIRKKRKQKRLQKECYESIKREKIQRRAELNRKIDQWLDLVKEKNLQLKREIEMKKEADNILSEVRKKIHEAKRTLEKLNIFEKLRQARKENAVKKGLIVPACLDQNFEHKLKDLKETMVQQLKDYEAEEKALKVMLETEQEGQREEEAMFRFKEMKKWQEKKQMDIIQGLFGNCEPPSPTDPLFLFWQYYNSGNASIDNLVKIRHVWDTYLVPPGSSEGSTIPQQWVAPELPSDKAWDFLERK